MSWVHHLTGSPSPSGNQPSVCPCSNAWAKPLLSLHPGILSLLSPAFQEITRAALGVAFREQNGEKDGPQKESPREK